MLPAVLLPAYVGASLSPLNMPFGARVQAWWHAARRLTLGTELLPNGSSGAPGTNTISADTGGTLTKSIALYIKVASSGTRGTATVDVYINGSGNSSPTYAGDGVGTPFAASLLTGADVAIPGLGIRIQFAIGTYTAGTHSYQSVIAQWDDLSGKSRSLVAPAGLTGRPLLAWQVLNGKPGVRSDATNSKHMSDSTSLANLLGTGTNKDFTIGFVGRSSTATPSAALAFCSLNNSGDSDSRWTASVKNGSNDYYSTQVDDAGATTAATHGGTLDTVARSLIWRKKATGVLDIFRNGSALSLTGSPAGSQSVGAVTYDDFTILGENRAGVPSNACPCDLHEIVCVDRSLTDPEVDLLDSYFRGGWTL